MLPLKSNTVGVLLIGLLVPPANRPAQAQRERSAPKAQASPSAALRATVRAEVRWWPQAPKGDQSLMVRGYRGNDLISQFKFAEPQATLPPNSPPQVLAVADKFKGRLVYLPYIKHPEIAESQHYFVLQGIGTPGLVRDVESPQASYHVDTFGYLSDPTFSPDARSLFYKNGLPPGGSNNSFSVTHWDFNKNTLGRVDRMRGDTVGHPRVIWSPDSRYICYVSGTMIGDIFEKPLPHELRAYDTNTQKVIALTSDFAPRTAARHVYFPKQDAVGAVPHLTFSWTPRGTLLYTRQKRTADSSGSRRTSRASFELPDIYEIGLSSRKPVSLIRYATNPVPSPDGRHIAFFGWTGEQAKEPDALSRLLPSLFLYDRTTKQRVKLDEASYGLLQWTPDGRTLLLLEPKNMGTGRGQATLKAILLSARQARVVTTLSAQNANQSEYSQFYAIFQFHGLKVSRDGRFAFVDVTEEGAFDEITATQTKTWQAVDLASGEASILARIENKWAGVLGWDWLDESTPSPGPN